MPPEEIRSPFITAVLDRRDHPDTPPPATVPLTDFWLAPPPAEED
jgi:hypothetical protein